jgi:hypothetical protein
MPFATRRWLFLEMRSRDIGLRGELLGSLYSPTRCWPTISGAISLGPGGEQGALDVTPLAKATNQSMVTTPGNGRRHFHARCSWRGRRSALRAGRDSLVYLVHSAAGSFHLKPLMGSPAP